MTILRQILVIGLLAALAAGGWTFARPLLTDADQATQAGKGRGDRAAKAVVARVDFAPERVQVEAVGTARALQSATLYPATAGEIVAINFTPDARVERGDVLLELDREAEELEVDLARVKLDDADRTFQRLQRLSTSGAVAHTTLDDARTTLASARIAMKRAEVALSDRFVMAPFGGRIGLSDLDVGDRIAPDTKIATLDERATLLVRFAVPEALLGRVRVGETASVVPWSSNDITAVGTVADVDSRVDEESRTFTVRARIPNDGDHLRPGMSFRVSLDIKGAEHARVPEIAIQWGGEGSYVWTVSDGAARRVPVTIVQRQEATVLVQGDIDHGSFVVIEGLHRMRDGSPVEILTEEQKKPTPIPASVKGAES